MSIVTNLTAQSAELFLSSFKSFPAQLQSINRKKYLLICTSLKHCICESSIPVSPPVFPPPTQVIFSNKGGESMILFPLQTLSPQKTTKPLWKTFPCSEPTPIPSAVLWISAEWSHSWLMGSHHGTPFLVSIRLFLLRCHLDMPSHRSMGLMLHPCALRMCGTVRG